MRYVFLAAAIGFFVAGFWNYLSFFWAVLFITTYWQINIASKQADRHEKWYGNRHEYKKKDEI